MMNNSDLRDLNDLVDTIKSGIDFKALDLSKTESSPESPEERKIEPFDPDRISSPLRQPKGHREWLDD